MNKKFVNQESNMNSAVEDLIEYYPQEEEVEDIDAVIEILLKTTPESQSPSLDHPLMDRVAKQFDEGEFDFLDPQSKENLHSIEFQRILLDILKNQFGTANGAYLLERWQAEKLSPNMTRRIDFLSRYAMEQHIRKKMREHDSTFDLVRELFLEAFQKGGLKEIDTVIKATNEKIKDSRVKLSPGSATVDDGSGNTEYVAIIFAAKETNLQLATDWLKL